MKAHLLFLAFLTVARLRTAMGLSVIDYGEVASTAPSQTLTIVK